MDSFCIKIAGLTVKINARTGYMRKFCRKYLVDDKAAFDFEVGTTDKEIEDIISVSEIKEPQSAEVAGLYANISRVLPRYNAVMMHGASISYHDEAYVFTAKSGVGKSTHIKLWKKYLGNDVGIINGDKPIVREIDGKLTVCGTPWCGKEGWNRNVMLPLKALCIIRRGEDNRIRRVPAPEAIDTLSWQIFIPKQKEEALIALDIYDKILTGHPVYELSCTISEDAVKASFEAMTGESYAGHNI